MVSPVLLVFSDNLFMRLIIVTLMSIPFMWSNASAERQLFDEQMPTGTSFEQCITAIQNGIKLAHKISDGQDVSSQSWYLFEDGIYHLFFFENWKGQFQSMLSCYKYPKIN